MTVVFSDGRGGQVVLPSPTRHVYTAKGLKEVPVGHTYNLYRGSSMVPDGTVTETIRKTADEKFLEFHRANPEVYETLVKLARAAKARGKTRVGMKMLWEVVRWTFFLETDTEDEFRLNNNYHSRYARMIMQNEQDLAGLFETRRLKT